jgi:hypothetical protein
VWAAPRWKQLSSAIAQQKLSLLHILSGTTIFKRWRLRLLQPEAGISTCVFASPSLALGGKPGSFIRLISVSPWVSRGSGRCWSPWGGGSVLRLCKTSGWLLVSRPSVPSACAYSCTAAPKRPRRPTRLQSHCRRQRVTAAAADASVLLASLSWCRCLHLALPVHPGHAGRPRGADSQRTRAGLLQAHLQVSSSSAPRSPSLPAPVPALLAACHRHVSTGLALFCSLPHCPRLLFHRIRPVFVFDGATPALKKQTTAARRR